MCFLVDSPRQVACLFVITQVHPGRRYREHRCADLQLVHGLERGFRIPNWELPNPVRRPQAGVDQRLPIKIWDVMRMHVDAIAQSGPVTIRLRLLHRFTRPGPKRES